MLLDIRLLQVLKYRTEYQKFIHAVPMAALDEKTQVILASFGKYWKKFPSHSKIDLDLFTPRFRQWNSAMPDETFQAYKVLLKQIQKDVDDETRYGLLGEVYEVDLATTVANLCNSHSQGELHTNLAEGVEAALDAYKLNIGAKDVLWNDTDIEQLLEDDLNQSGLRWRLNCLNRSMRPLRAGDFGILAGRPDKGKTSFCASEVTHLATQLPPDRNVLWLNNEGVSGRIVKRLYQSALGLTITEMVELAKSGKLTRMYEKVVGRRDRIRVVDIHGFHVGQVQAIIEASNPGLIIYDMIDKIKGFQFDQSRTDLALEQMYDWGRERAVKYDCVGLATSQISNEGDNMSFPTLGMLKDSKTGKQGACDFQIMIGSKNGPEYQSVRWISLPKNKLAVDGAPSDPHCEVFFDSRRSRFLDDEDAEEVHVEEQESEPEQSKQDVGADEDLDEGEPA